MSTMVDNQGYQGNYTEDSTHYLYFTVCNKDGASVAYSGSPVVSCYKNISDTQSTAGLSITNITTGLYYITIATTDSFYEVGYNYSIVITGITVDTEAISPAVGCFGINYQA